MKSVYCFTLITFGIMTLAFPQGQRKTFVMVHAQWHGGWCWEKVVPLLQNKGHQAIAFDLPGHGSDTSRTETITLEDCVEKVVTTSMALPGQVILVGHSSSGIVIAQAAEILGKDKVMSLVFVDGFLPNDGESVFSLAEKYASSGTPLAKSFILSNDQQTISLNLDDVQNLLYHDCSAADVNLTKSKLRPGPQAVLATAAKLSEKNYGAIPKYYILCTKARDMEKTRLAKNVSCKKVYTLASSHSPFFSMPEELVKILEKIP